MRLLQFLLLVFLLWNCHLSRPQQVLLRKDNPMPNEVSREVNLERKMITTVANGKFRDASIHIGSETSIVMNNLQRGVDAVAVVDISALPSKDMLNTNLEDFDLSKMELMHLVGESAGCQTGVTIYVPVGDGDRKRYVPVNFTFAKNSFYDDLRKKMEQEKVVALLDARLDKERQSYVFGIFRRECIRFHAIGVRKKVGL